MDIEITKLRTLANVRRDSIQKRWILEDKNYFSKMCDVLQKINYSICDLNDEMQYFSDFKPKDIIYIISLIDWIVEAFDACKKLIRKDIISNYSYSKQDELEVATKFFKALRSYVVAHPLSTDRHGKYGLDGNFICIDIAKWDPIIDCFHPDEYFYHLGYDGLQEKVKLQTDNILLRSYSDKEDGMRFSRSITCNIKDIYHVAELYIDSLYELNIYLSHQKKSMYS